VIILDWRPAWERHFTARWSDGGQAILPPGRRGNIIENTWARVVDSWQARSVEKRQPPAEGPLVVSVGNLALGGTGKTPVIMALARDLAGSGKRGCILTRGFRSPLAGPLAVSPDNELAGDEARLMAGQLALHGWPVIQSRDRSRGLPFIRENLGSLDFILLEDGHQTRGVGRHLDILILDRWTEQTGFDVPCLQPETGPVFPLGPYRESRTGAQRAQILLVESTAELPDRGCHGQQTATFSRRPVLRPVGSVSEEYKLAEPHAVVSGIARPTAFESSLAALVGFPATLAIRLRDHQEYSPRLARRICSAMDDHEARTLVTTAKDWVKLKPFWPGQHPVTVVDLDLEWGHRNALPQLVEERARNRSGKGF
jgi:tetraacyldisaccharide 4'-kinase